MTIQVVGAGFGRTGSQSLRNALEIMGFGPCHHMQEVFENSQQLIPWQRAIKDGSVRWSEVFAGYRATVDWPSTYFVRELAEAYPASKVVLTVRSADQWWESFSQTIKKLLLARNDVPDAHVRSVLEMANVLISENTFGGDLSRDHAIHVFQDWIQTVKKMIPADRLLVFEVSQGWEPLCAFLQQPLPSVDFPRGNSRSEFWNTFGGRVGKE